MFKPLFFLIGASLYTFSSAQVINTRRCPQYSSYQSYIDQCVCWGGYKMIDGVCTDDVICPQFSSYQSWQNKCVCWNHYIDNGKGQCVNPCLHGWQLDYMTQSKCVKRCPWNLHYDQIVGECIPCPAYSLYQPSIDKCRCIANFQVVEKQCLPTCLNGQVRIDQNCVCPNNQFLIKGSCGNCQSTQIYDPIKLNCVCAVGYIADQTGNCVKICQKENSSYDIATIKCVCDQTYNEDANGNCIKPIDKLPPLADPSKPPSFV